MAKEQDDDVRYDIDGMKDVLEFGPAMGQEDASSDGGLIGRTTLQSAIARIQDLESKQKLLKQENESELNKLRSWYRQLEVKWQEEKSRADREMANIQLVLVEKQHLQEQINELQSAAGNMASTAESVHKWLEDRTRTARREWQQEKTRADQNASSVEALAQEKQELVQQLNELHAAADNMVTTAAESVHQLVEERTRVTLQEVAEERARADDEARRVENLERERKNLLERLEQAQKQLQVPSAAAWPAQDSPAKSSPVKAEETAQMSPRAKSRIDQMADELVEDVASPSQEGLLAVVQEISSSKVAASPAQERSKPNGLAVEGSQLKSSPRALSPRVTSSRQAARMGPESVPSLTTIASLPNVQSASIRSPADGGVPALSHVQLTPMTNQPQIQPPIQGQLLSAAASQPQVQAQFMSQAQIQNAAAAAAAAAAAGLPMWKYPPPPSSPAPTAPGQSWKGSSRVSLPSPRPQSDSHRAQVSAMMPPSSGVLHPVGPQAMFAYFNPNTAQQTSSTRQTSPGMVRREASPFSSHPDALIPGRSSLGAVHSVVGREASPFPEVVRQASPRVTVLTREQSPASRQSQAAHIRCISSSSSRMRSIERPTDRSVSPERRCASRCESVERRMEPSVSASTLESVAVPSLSSSIPPLIAAASSVSMPGSATSPVQGSPTGSWTGAMVNGPGVTTFYQYAPVVCATRAVSPSPLSQRRPSRPMTPRSSSPNSVFRSVTHAVLSRSGSLIAPSDGIGSVFRSSSNPVSTTSTPASSRHGSLVPPIKGRNAKRSESSQLPRLTSGVPWQPSENDVVIATLEGNKAELTSPHSVAGKSSGSDGASGVTCIDLDELGGVSSIPSSPGRELGLPAGQRASAKPLQDPRSNSLAQRGAVSPQRQTPSEPIVTSKVVPLMSRLPPGGKAPVIPSQEFICSDISGQRPLLTEFKAAPPLCPPPVAIWAGNPARGGSGTLPAKLVQAPTSPVPRSPLGERQSSPVKNIKSASCTLPIGFAGRSSMYLPGLDTSLASLNRGAPMPVRETPSKPVRVVPAAATTPRGTTFRSAFSAVPVTRQSSTQRRGLEVGGYEHVVRGRTPARVTEPSRQEYTPRQQDSRTAVAPSVSVTPQPMLPGTRVGQCSPAHA